MPEYCALVLSGARARFFTLEEPAQQPFEGGPDLVECEDLANPGAILPDRELYSNLRGASRAPSGAAKHRYDDHREAHDSEDLRRFVKTAVEHALALAERQGGGKLVVVADAQLLGRARPLIAAHANAGLRVFEVNKDLSRQSPTQIHQHLAQTGVLPQRRPPSHSTNGRRTME